MDVRLVTTRRVEVFETIKARGIDPLMFSWDDVKRGSHTISVLRFPEDYFYFEFGYNPDAFDNQYGGRRAPGSEQREVTYRTNRWENVLVEVSHWIDSVKREMSTPDPWKALPGFTEVTQLQISPRVANTQFSSPEAQQVAKGLDEIRKLLLDYCSTSKERLALIDEQINSLAASSATMGRKDWFNLAVGTLINLALMIALPPEITRQVFDLLKASLNGIIHLLPPLGAAASQLSG